MARNALAEYAQAFYDRSREPIGGNALNVRYGDLLPYYGNALSFDDARREYEQGNYGAAALTAGMTAIPWGGLIRKGSGALKREMVAYHGTPHQFDEFKMDKIGTGEGFQSQGHGLYFSEAPEVAEHYKASLSNGGGGNVYRADIPDKEKMLDWDARLSEQPAIKTLLQQPGVYSDSIRKAIDKNMTGEGLYQALQLSIGKENASRFLNSVGIPGARYLDEFSRAKGGGTHNFVVWDEGQIKHLGPAE